ncbi:MAG: amidohydrolase [Saprospirales bacterium]|nr:MAG: amidohydrolase [Saprospirales bacterium]
MKKKYPINCHTHIFSLSIIPENVMGRKWGFALNLMKTGEKDSLVKFIRMVFNRFSVIKCGHRLKALAKTIVGCDSQKEVLNKLIKSYNDLGYEDMKFVVLCQDMDHTGIKSQNYVDAITQMYEVYTIMQDDYFSKRILPFVAVDPRSTTEPLSLVKKFIEKGGFKGIKIYPTVGFFGDDERLIPVYEYACKHHLPVLVHYTGGVIFYRGNLPYRPDKSVFNYRKNHLYQYNFLNPHYFRKVLKKFPDLKICFAHFAGTMDKTTLINLCNYKLDPYDYFEKQRWETSKPDKEEVRAYMHKYIVQLIKDNDYPNVYTDIAFEFSKLHFVNKVIEYMEDEDQPTLRRRILFGTDFFVNAKNKNYKDERGLVSQLRHRMDEGLLHQMMVQNNHEFLESDFLHLP